MDLITYLGFQAAQCDMEAANFPACDWYSVFLTELARRYQMAQYAALEQERSIELQRYGSRRSDLSRGYRETL